MINNDFIKLEANVKIEFNKDARSAPELVAKELFDEYGYLLKNGLEAKVESLNKNDHKNTIPTNGDEEMFLKLNKKERADNIKKFKANIAFLEAIDHNNGINSNIFFDNVVFEMKAIQQDNERDAKRKRIKTNNEATAGGGMMGFVSSVFSSASNK